MKKFFILSLIAFMSITANAKILKFGVKAGLNYSSASVSSTINEVSNMKFSSEPGFNVGGMVNLSILKIIQVEADLLYSNQRYKANCTVDNGSHTSSTAINHFVNIPLALKYSPIAGLYFEVGPQYSYLISSNNFDTPALSDPKHGGNKRSEVGVFAGAGYKFADKVLVNARYTWGLNDTSKIIGNVKNRNFQVSLGYLF